jgi:Xaa-Pro aminopeptidase
VNARVARLREALEEPLLVTTPCNVFYLSGFRSSNAALLVESERARLFSDFRYAAAGRGVEGVEFVETPRALVRSLAEQLEGRIGFEADHLVFAAYETLRGGGLDLVPRRGLVERLRAIKDERELAAIRRAAAITDRAYERLAEQSFVRRTERELAWKLEGFLRQEGAEAIAFPLIVASGANGARPHAVSGDRTVEPNQTVVVDAGCTVDGYSSDCTRTFATGPLPERLEEAYAVCLDAQVASLEQVRAGAIAKQVDAGARSRIDETEFRGAFGHGLGHGVGLLVHEDPSMRPESEETLAAGNVVTVEPGIYLEELGGIRIEDLVVVRDGPPEVLSTFTKELVTVG